MTSRGPEERPARRRLGRALAELHYRLRTEHDAPGRHACAIGVGAFLGCLPLYGAHLALCWVVGRWLRLNRLNMYLAAHLNNPLTAPVLVMASLAVGHRLARGAWPRLGPGGLRASTVADLGGFLALGSVGVGLLVGLVAAALAFLVGRGAPRDAPWQRLAEATAKRYFECGVFHWEFARGKLRGDPLYREIVSRLAPTLGGRIVDLGCGRGLVLALLDMARTEPAGRYFQVGVRPESDPVELVGVELRPRLAAVARQALGERVRIEVADLTAWSPPEADAFLLLDVLHYLKSDAQVVVLARLAAALRPGGQLLVREADSARPLRFFLTRSGERLAALARGHWRQRFHYRSAAAWAHLLASQGLETTTSPLWRRTPFANVLIGARRAP
jgi:uncharacterized protein (DUF2062 family)/trans-aconitate methyltransferase